jgi:PilZ domain
MGEQARKELRRTPRSSIRMPVTWSVREGLSRLVDDGELRDATPDGAFLQLFCITTHPLWPGTKIRLAMHGPSGEITASGRVRWIGLHPGHQNLPGIGIQFDKPEPALGTH